MWMRTGLVLGLLLALGLAGCRGDNRDGVATAGGRGKASASPSALNDKEAALRHARCMRENGVPNFPDPEFEKGGGIRLRAPEGVSKEKLDAAMKKCKKYLPNGGEPPKADPERLKKMREYAECMRKNGVPNFPDPNQNGGLMLKDIDPDDPKFKAAEKACAKYDAAPRGGKLDRRAG